MQGTVHIFFSSGIPPFYQKALPITGKQTNTDAYAHIQSSERSPLTGTPKVDGRGKHAKHYISADKNMEVRNHIESFPTTDSHYCRAKTNKKYVVTS